jgi:hypothetical protein
MKNKHHHPLLFSKWFPYLWKAIYKSNDSYYEQEYYGTEDRGYFYKLDNGLRFKIFKHGEVKNEIKYAVYVYFYDLFVMNYNTVVQSHSWIVMLHPLVYASIKDMEYLLSCIKKTIPESTLSIFRENIKNFEELPTFNFRITTNEKVENKNYKIFIIEHYNNKDDPSKYDNIYLIKKFNEYYSAKRDSHLGFSSTGFFSEDIDKSYFKKIQQIDTYTSSSYYYTLYPLCTPAEMKKVSPYKQATVKNSEGFVVESGHEYYFFMFHNSFISCVNYSRGWMGEHETVSNVNGLEMTFAKKLTTLMLRLQKRNPSSKFCDYLTEMGIEGVEYRRGNGITDEQWLLYEMMDI